eukprot:TRINITY_DN1773_c4_g1_i1.p2 TRINITY_DN1773_c4_g1~~TRINITY_DN1773_c4_g1_i1.p2  ORF type:complete len:362 (+),score=53.44 TRINITY_DN1773_c4_g1_i1:635-1720(+)
MHAAHAVCPPRPPFETAGLEPARPQRQRGARRTRDTLAQAEAPHTTPSSPTTTAPPPCPVPRGQWARKAVPVVGYPARAAPACPPPRREDDGRGERRRFVDYSPFYAARPPLCRRLRGPEPPAHSTQLRRGGGGGGGGAPAARRSGAMSGMLRTAVISTPVVLVLRTIDFEDEDNLFILRSAFLCTQLALACCIGRIYQQISAKANDTPVQVYEAVTPLSVATRAGAEKTEEEPVEMTVQAYHKAQMNAFIFRMSVGLFICLALHGYFGYCLPLFFQCWSNPAQLWRSPLFKIHMLKHPEADYPLPWREEKPIQDMWQASWNPSKRRELQRQEKQHQRLQKANKKVMGEDTASAAGRARRR